MIRWFANNSIAANLLMIAILLGGIYTAFFRIPLEVQPTREYNVVYIEMPYRGGTAKDVERGVLIPIEEALEGLNGIKMLHADGSRGFARLWIECADGHDIRILQEEVKSRIDGITTFPSETERPRIRVPNSGERHDVITVAVTGDLEEHELREIAKTVEQHLLEIDGISLTRLEGVRGQEISIEANQATLEAYGLGLRDLSDAIRRWSVDLPAGSIHSESGTLVVRTRGQARRKREFEEILVRASNGAEVLLKDVATVHDGFEEGDKVVEFNGAPAVFVDALRAGNENAIEIAELVHEYVDGSAALFPDGVRLYAFDDESIAIRGRLGTLTSSLFQGSLLVFVILGLFLRPALAFGSSSASPCRSPAA